MTEPHTQPKVSGRDASGFAPAKINLCLHVTGQRGDGYHRLESLVVFADLGDVLSFCRSGALSLRVRGPQAAGVPCDGRNLVLRAACLAGVEGGEFTLEKHLPAAAGIGGGSSDAAATLRLLARITGRPIPENVLDLGADVPVCLSAKASRVAGVGAELTPLPGLPRLWAVLANPGGPLSTPAVFNALKKKENAPMPAVVPAFADARACARWLADQRNDLEAPARELQPVIGLVLRALGARPGCLLARMSGSGATCFALFGQPEAAASAAAVLAGAHPDWWVRACALN